MATYTVTTNEHYHKIIEKGQTFEVYRVTFENALMFANFDELTDTLSEPGVYLLIKDLKGERPEVYVGEAEPLRERIKQHVAKRNNEKEFCWTELIVFVNIHNEWSKADVKYIENGIYNELKNSDFYKINNSSTPTKSKVPDPTLCQKHIGAIKLLSTFFGHPKLFEKGPIEKTSQCKTVCSLNGQTYRNKNTKPTINDKVGRIARYYIAELLKKEILTENEIAYLCSNDAKRDFKTAGFLVIKVFHGNENEYLSKDGKGRYYKMPPIKCRGREYIITSQFYERSKLPLVKWLRSHGIKI